MQKLNQSEVVFVEASHQYFLGDKELYGITGMLSRQLFPIKYDGVAKGILERAKTKGSLVHSEIEQFIKHGQTGITDEFIDFLKLVKENNLKPIASEYLVSDNNYFATKVDIVFDKNGEIELNDIKTTYELDKEYLSWQLSINAYLFELQNPNLKVSKLSYTWLGSKREYGEIERKPTAEIIKLLNCEINNEQYQKQELVVDDQIILRTVELETLIKALDKQIETVKEQKKQLSDFLLTQMKQQGLKSFENDKIKITYVEPYSRTTLDSTAIKENEPKIYEQYKKETQIGENLKITIKKGEI